MPNTSGNAYALTLFCPIKNEHENGITNGNLIRNYLQELPTEEKSPLAKVANTYLARFYVLDDALFQSFPNKLDTLQSKYLVFSSDFYGDLNTYLIGMWNERWMETSTGKEDFIQNIWGRCVGFETVNSPSTFIAYIKKCQVNTTFFFNGSTDDSLQEQLKSLYLKQEFSKFVFSHQGIPAAQLLADFKEFIKDTQPKNLLTPTWIAGSSTQETVLSSKVTYA